MSRLKPRPTRLSETIGIREERPSRRTSANQDHGEKREGRRLRHPACCESWASCGVTSGAEAPNLAALMSRLKPRPTRLSETIGIREERPSRRTSANQDHGEKREGRRLRHPACCESWAACGVTSGAEAPDLAALMSRLKRRPTRLSETIGIREERRSRRTSARSHTPDWPGRPPAWPRCEDLCGLGTATGGVIPLGG
jgi:hypothetical protein